MPATRLRRNDIPLQSPAGTLKLLTVKARAIEIQWSCTDGSITKARIYKTLGSDSFSKNVFIKGGVEYLDTIELREPSENSNTADNDTGWDYAVQYGIKIKKPDASTKHRIKLYIPPTAPPVYLAYNGANEKMQIEGLFFSCDPTGRGSQDPSTMLDDHHYWLDYGTHLLGQPHHVYYDKEDTLQLKLFTKQQPIAIDGQPTFTCELSGYAGGDSNRYKGPGYKPVNPGQEHSPFAKNKEAGTRVEQLTYKSATYPVRLQKGVLDVRGTPHPTCRWRDSWKRVNSGVKDFRGAACGQGPVIAYTKDNRLWKVVRYHYRTGAVKNLGTIKGTPTFLAPGSYGIYIKAMNDDHFESYLYNFEVMKKAPIPFGVQ